MGNQNPISSEAIEKQKQIAKAAQKKVLKSPQQTYAVKCKDPISKMFPVLLQKIAMIKKQKNFQGVTHITEYCPVYYLTALDCYYQGQWKDSMPNGCGIAVYKDLSYYQGDFDDSQLKTNEGFYFFNNGVDKIQEKVAEKIQEEDLLLQEKYKKTTSTYYIGSFLNSKFEGKGTICHKGIVYEGQWKNGVREGEGKQYSIAQSYSFHGKFIKGLKSGKGIYTRKVNNKSYVYEGSFKCGIFHGIGKIHINDHIYYSGQFEQGQAQGKGQIYLRSVIYKGQFHKNLIKGEGELTFIQSQKGVIKGIFNQSVNEEKTKRQIYYNKQKLITDEYYQFPLIVIQH